MLFLTFTGRGDTEFKKLFKSVKFFAAENDSIDDTYELAKKYSSKVEGEVFNFQNLNSKYKYRTHRLAFLRNFLLEKARNYDYIIVVDGDSILKNFDSDGLKNCFEYDVNSWDAFGANCDNKYYDVWTLRDDKLNIAIRTLDGMIGERGYPTKRLEEEMKSINQGNAIDNMTEGRDGGSTESTVLEQLLNSAKADIIWKVTWTKESNGIQNWIEYGIEALDSYTSKAFAVEDGSGSKSMSAGEGDLIRQAVTDKMDAFLSEHQSYFNKITEDGREINIEIRRFDSFEYYFNDDIEFKGREMELSDLIRGFAGSISKDRNFSFSSTENQIDLKSVRIDMFEEIEDVFSGETISQPLDAETFAKKISRFIKDQFGYDSKVLPFGLGKARITVGEK